MKYQTTERGRQVLLAGMDIFGGSAICTGPNNIFSKFYQAAPIGITVEGSNILTRNLITFGQGLNKSHPFIYPIFTAITDNDLTAFRTQFNGMIKMAVANYAKSFRVLGSQSGNTKQRLDLLCIRFSNLSNFVALLGGKIKANQMISGNMADILSCIYMSHALLNYKVGAGQAIRMVNEYCISHLCNEAERKMNYVIDNYPNVYIRAFIKPFRYRELEMSIADVNRLYELVVSSPEVLSVLKEDLYIPPSGDDSDSLVSKLERLDKIPDRNSQEYMVLYDDIVSVGEFPVV